MKVDVIVLGGGIIGTSCALHLQKRGLSVGILDHGKPGRGTSFGHAGLIERAAVVPMAFPRSPAALLKYALNQSSALHYDPFHLAGMASWLLRYWWHSAPKRLRQASADLLPLIERSVSEHDLLAAEVGATDLFLDRGWIELCRNDAALEMASAQIRQLAPYGLAADVLDQTSLQKLEPHLTAQIAGGVHWRDPKSTINPAGLIDRYVSAFEARGGVIMQGDARSLETSGSGWQVSVQQGRLQGDQVLLALGPWSGQVLQPLGYRIPLNVKRGHHLHFRHQDGLALNRPVLDDISGYVLSPMAAGIRMTTGIDFSPATNPPTLKQVTRARQQASRVFPLGPSIESTPWVGLRPCLPDMRPVIGPAPRHKGLWFAFGHAHHGFTLGPVTGRLVADLITGVVPFTDPSPYRADRFAESR